MTKATSKTFLFILVFFIASTKLAFASNLDRYTAVEGFAEEKRLLHELEAFKKYDIFTITACVLTESAFEALPELASFIEKYKKFALTQKNFAQLAGEAYAGCHSSREAAVKLILLSRDKILSENGLLSIDGILNRFFSHEVPKYDRLVHNAFCDQFEPGKSLDVLYNLRYKCPGMLPKDLALILARNQKINDHQVTLVRREDSEQILVIYDKYLPKNSGFYGQLSPHLANETLALGFRELVLPNELVDQATLDLIVMSLNQQKKIALPVEEFAALNEVPWANLQYYENMGKTLASFDLKDLLGRPARRLIKLGRDNVLFQKGLYQFYKSFGMEEICDLPYERHIVNFLEKLTKKKPKARSAAIGRLKTALRELFTKELSYGLNVRDQNGKTHEFDSLALRVGRSIYLYETLFGLKYGRSNGADKPFSVKLSEKAKEISDYVINLMEEALHDNELAITKYIE